MSALPGEARAGLMRAWLAILSERHPHVTWIPVEPESERQGKEASQLLVKKAAA